MTYYLSYTSINTYRCFYGLVSEKAQELQFLNICYQYKMYETIRKNLTNIQEIKNNNQACYLLSKITSSKPTMTADCNKITMPGLRQMLLTRNKRYDFNSTTNLYDLSSNVSGAFNTGRPPRSQQMIKKKKQSKDILIYQYQQLEECLQNICEQYCDFSLHSQINIQQDSLNNHNQNSFTKIIQGLRKFNLQQISKQNSEVGSSLRLIRYCAIATPYFQQLARQIELVKQNESDGTILLKIFQSFGTSVSEASIYRHIEQLERKTYRNNDDKWKNILLVFLIDTPESRVNLKQYLYKQNQSQIFQLIQHYDNFFEKSAPKQFKLQRLFQYSRQLSTFRRKQSSIYCKALTNLMNFQNVLNLKQQFGQFEFQFENVVVLAIIKTLKWLQIKFHQPDDTLSFHRIIFKNFQIIKSQLSKMLLSSSEPVEFQSFNHLKLMNYHQSFSLIQNCEEKLFLTLLICNEGKIMEKLFIIQKNSSILGEHEEVQLKKFQTQLVQQIKTNFLSHIHVNFIIDCTKLMRFQDKVDILLSSKKMVQSIDWQYLCALTQKEEMKKLMKDVILKSIKMYQNTKAFLNTGIPIQTYLPKFEMQILIQGLIKVLTEDIKLNEKEKKIFFGMIETFRVNLHEKHQFLMTILQMLFEWYVLRQSMFEQDFKSLGLALKSNLQENSEQSEAIFNSVALTQSSRGGQVQKVHNDAYIRKIGDPQFMQKISHHEQFQVLYVKYLHTLIQSICKAKINRQMKFVRSRIEKWVETYLNKLNDNIKQSKGQFHKMLWTLRQNCIKLTAMHQI